MLDPNGIYYSYLRKSRKDLEAEQQGEGETLARHKRVLDDLAKKWGLLYQENTEKWSLEKQLPPGRKCSAC